MMKYSNHLIMDNIKTFITNPLSGLLAGITAGTLAGYQYGFAEGRKENATEINDLKLQNTRMDERLKMNDERFLLLMKKMEFIESKLSS